MRRLRSGGERIYHHPEACSSRSAAEEAQALAGQPEELAHHEFSPFEGVVIDGFQLGTITARGADIDFGAACVTAPDQSRAGLLWRVSGDPSFSPLAVLSAQPTRWWGVFSLEVPFRFDSVEHALRGLRLHIPMLRSMWEAWIEWTLAAPRTRSPEPDPEMELLDLQTELEGLPTDSPAGHEISKALADAERRLSESRADADVDSSAAYIETEQQALLREIADIISRGAVTAEQETLRLLRDRLDRLTRQIEALEEVESDRDL